MPARAAIALGSNRGDRRAHIEAALAAMGALPGTTLIAASEAIETAPVGMAPGEEAFLNAAALLDTQLPPRELLEHLLRIERERGRVRPPHPSKGPWGRTLDLDLLLYSDLIIHEPGLTLPHPRMHERLFVLEPLARITPALLIPTLQRTVSELRDHLRAAVPHPSHP